MQAQPGTGVNLSSAYIETDRFKDAEKILSQFIKQRKNLSYDHPERIYHNYGLLAEKTNRSVLAESMFKKAVEENPMFYMSHMQLVRIYRDKRKPSLLQKQLEAARFACPICYEPMADLVELHNQKGDILTARQLIQDYKLTEGVAQADRKRLLILENRLIELAKRQTQDAAQKNR